MMPSLGVAERVVEILAEYQIEAQLFLGGGNSERLPQLRLRS